jgi:hypothetical protein
VDDYEKQLSELYWEVSLHKEVIKRLKSKFAEAVLDLKRKRVVRLEHGLEREREKS